MNTGTSSQARETTSRPWIWAAVVCVLGLAVAGLTQAFKKTPEPVVNQLTMPGPQDRNTTDTDVARLVARLNRFTSATMGSKYLLPANLKEDVRNDLFHAYSVGIPTGQIKIEASNKTGRPFSMSMISAAEDNRQVAEQIALMGAIGATMLGKGPQAGALMTTCTTAADAPNKSHTVSVGDFNVFCSNLMGAWVAGISVDKDASLASGITAVPMQPDSP